MSEYRRSTEVHHFGWDIVQCPRYRARAFVRGWVADRVPELLVTRAAGGRSIVETLELLGEGITCRVRGKL